MALNRLNDEELISELRNRMSENRQALQELTVLNEKLVAVNRKLEESEMLKSHFISHIANEIVNPFTSIIGLSGNLLSVKGENWEKAINMVNLIHAEAFSLDFQFRNIFAAAKIEAGEIYLETGNVDVKGILTDIAESFKIEAGKKGIVLDMVFDLSDATVFNTDPEKLKLILSNLVNNAVKFSSDNQKITVKTVLDDGKLLISIHNFGRHIPDEYKVVIFDRFKRIDSSITSMNRGHGLGLSVVASLVDLLGGEISFTSDSINGTVFTLSVPESSGSANSFSESLSGNELFFTDNNIF